MSGRRSFSLLIAGLPALYSTMLFAAPDAGTLHQERSADKASAGFQANDQSSLNIVPPPLPAVNNHNKVQTVYISGFSVHGNTRLSDDELKEVLAPYINRQVSVAEVHQAATDLQQRYLDDGLLLAEVVIPSQIIQDHTVVTLHVYEGQLAENGVYLVNSGERVSDPVIHQILVSNLSSGEPVMQADIERTMLLSGDLPGINVSGSLLPAAQAGEAVLQLITEDTALVNGDLYVDNFGDYYTGQTRVGGSLFINSPAKRGDQLTLDFVTSGEGSVYGYGQYSLPVGGSGLRLGASLDYLNYELGEEYEDFDVKGHAYEATLLGHYPLRRSVHHNLRLNGILSSLRMHDEDNINGESDRRVDKLQLGMDGDQEVTFYRTAEFSYGLSLNLGQLSILGDDNYKAADKLTTDTDGTFALLRYHAAWLQHLGGDWSAFAMLDGQFAGSNLDTSQKFYVGGPYDVAGYPVAEVSGDQGTQLHMDVRYDFRDGLMNADTQLSVFYSQGWVTLFKDPWSGWEGSNDQIKNNFSLKSIGLSLHNTWPQGYQLQAIIARQLGDNPGSDPQNGEDSDRSDSDYRGWLQLVYFF